MLDTAAWRPLKHTCTKAKWGHIRIAIVLSSTGLIPYINTFESDHVVLLRVFHGFRLFAKMTILAILMRADFEVSYQLKCTSLLVLTLSGCDLFLLRARPCAASGADRVKLNLRPKMHKVGLPPRKRTLFSPRPLFTLPQSSDLNPIPLSLLYYPEKKP